MWFLTFHMSLSQCADIMWIYHTCDVQTHRQTCKSINMMDQMSKTNCMWVTVHAIFTGFRKSKQEQERAGGLYVNKVWARWYQIMIGYHRLNLLKLTQWKKEEISALHSFFINFLEKKASLINWGLFKASINADALNILVGIWKTGKKYF